MTSTTQDFATELQTICERIDTAIKNRADGLPSENFARLVMLKDEVQGVAKEAEQPAAEDQQARFDEYLRRYVNYAQATFELWEFH